MDLAVHWSYEHSCEKASTLTCAWKCCRQRAETLWHGDLWPRQGGDVGAERLPAPNSPAPTERSEGEAGDPDPQDFFANLFPTGECWYGRQLHEVEQDWLLHSEAG